MRISPIGAALLIAGLLASCSTDRQVNAKSQDRDSPSSSIPVTQIVVCKASKTKVAGSFDRLMNKGLYIEKSPAATTADITSMFWTSDTAGNPAIMIEYDPETAKRLRAHFADWVGHQVAYLLNDRIVVSARLVMPLDWDRIHLTFLDPLGDGEEDALKALERKLQK